MANDGIQRNDNRKGFKTVQFSAYSKEIDVIMKKISFLEKKHYPTTRYSSSVSKNLTTKSQRLCK